MQVSAVSAESATEAKNNHLAGGDMLAQIACTIESGLKHCLGQDPNMNAPSVAVPWRYAHSKAAGLKLTSDIQAAALSFWTYPGPQSPVPKPDRVAFLWL